MKTTVEIPDAVFREAKSEAARQGVTLKQVFTEAVRRQLARPAGAGEPAWKKAFGGLRDLHRETQRVEKSIRQEFERIDAEQRLEKW